MIREDGRLRITAVEVDHAPIAPAYAYRFDYKGRSVLVTGDLKFHAAAGPGGSRRRRARVRSDRACT